MNLQWITVFLFLWWQGLTRISSEIIWVVVANMFFLFYPYLRKWSTLTNIFHMGWNHKQEKYPPYNKQLAHANQRVGRWILFWDGYFQGICWFQGGYHVDSRRRPTANHSAKSWAPRTNAPCFVVKCLDWRWDETNNIPTTTNANYKQKITSLFILICFAYVC